MGGQGRRCKQQLDNLKGTGGCWKLKKETLDVTVEIKRPTRCNRLVSLLQNLLFAQHVSDTIMLIIRSSTVGQSKNIPQTGHITHSSTPDQ